MVPQAQGLTEYATLLGTVGGGIVSGVSSVANYDPLNLLLAGGVFVFFYWLFVYKL